MLEWGCVICVAGDVVCAGISTTSVDMCIHACTVLYVGVYVCVCVCGGGVGWFSKLNGILFYTKYFKTFSLITSTNRQTELT